MNMTAKQWAARAVMAAAMAAGLSACGGGGDGAAPAAVTAPEELRAGLTLRNSIGDSPANGTYVVNVDFVIQDKILNSQAGGTDAPGITTLIFTNDNVSTTFGGTISFTSDGTVTRAILHNRSLQDNPVACGIDGIGNACSGFKIDLTNKKFSATSVLLKAVDGTWTGLNTTKPGQVTVSGIVAFN